MVDGGFRPSGMSDPGGDSRDLEPEDLLERSPVFCLAPWVHLHVLPEGHVYPCCQAGHRPANAVGDLRSGERLVDAWNGPALRSLRQRMLRGEESSICERCYRAERLGLPSMRQDLNHRFVHAFDQVRSTDAVGGVARFHVPYLDVRFSNRCNYACRICEPKLSSRWRSDALALGEIDEAFPRVLEAYPGPETWRAELESLLPGIEQLHFAGGEPLLMDQHAWILRRLVESDRFDVYLSYNTNLSVLSHDGLDFPPLWSRFRDVVVVASLDAAGPRGDYLRSGQRWSRIEENRRRLAEECPGVRFAISPTVSVHNVLHLPDLYRDWRARGWLEAGGMRPSLLYEPSWYSIQSLPAGLKRRARQVWERFIADDLDPEGAVCDELVGSCRGILEHLDERAIDRSFAFRYYTNRLDELRRESFTETFPELAGLLRSGDEGAVDVDPDPEGIDIDYRIRCTLGARAHREGDIVLAEDQFHAARDLDPDRPWAVAGLARCRAEAGDAEGAARDLARAEDLGLEAEHAYGIHCQIGHLWLKSGSVDRAWPEYEAARRRSPDRPWAVAGLAGCRAEEGDAEGAARDLARAEDLGLEAEHAYELRCRIGHVWLDSGSVDRASTEFEIARRRCPERPRAHADLARCGAESGDAEGATRHLSRAEELGLDPEDAFGLRCRIGHAWLESGSVDRASTEYEIARRLCPELPGAHADLARCAADSDAEGATRHLSRAEELGLDVSEAYGIHCQIGHAWLASGSVARAWAEYETARQGCPDRPWAVAGLAGCRTEEGDAEGAAKLLARAEDLGLEAEYAYGIHGRIGHVWLASGSVDRASAEYEIARRLCPERPGAYADLARCGAESGDAEGATRHLRRAEELGLDPEDAYGLRCRIGHAWLESGSVDRALAEYEIARRLCPELPRAYADLATCRAEARDAEGAARHLARAEALGLAAGQAYGIRCRIGYVWLEEGDVERALRSYESARTLVPGDWWAEAGLARCWSEKGDPVQARRHLDLAIDGGLDARLERELRDRLRRASGA